MPSCFQNASLSLLAHAFYQPQEQTITMSSTSDVASEKAQFEHKENVLHASETFETEGQTVDPAFAKRVRRKIDLRLIPIIAALYCISLIDRTNISVARVAGMAKDLELTVGERYSIISCVFFVPYSESPLFFRPS